MRELLSSIIVDQAKADPRFIVLSGDHGYALFDAIRRESPSQFVNVGVCEQGMVGYSAGLAAVGFKPVIYGLASFVPIRVLEQIKLDLCFPSLPVVILGDGAGVVYSSLGSSHQCAEDVACLQPMPNMSIFSPCDEYELRRCFDAAFGHQGPSYIRIGKSDRPAAHASLEQASHEPHWVHEAKGAKACLVSTGSMVSLCQAIARECGAAALSVPTLKPLHASVPAVLGAFDKVIVVEEHSRFGGLHAAISQALASNPPQPFPRLSSLSLMDKFAEKCGSYQYALSEHALSDPQVRSRVRAELGLEA